MKRKIITILLALGLIGISACNGNDSNVRASDTPQKVSASSDRMPDWVLKKKKDAQNVYFVGMSTRLKDLKEAKKASIDDATMQLVEYIGFRATTRFKSSKEMSDQDNVSSFKENIQQSIEGKGNAKVNIDVEDVYYEQYSDNSYTIYTLIKFPQDWVAKERIRLQKLVADQRLKATSLIEHAQEVLLKGELSSSLDQALMALDISEKAAENSDLYDQAKTLITEILSSLSFSIEGSPKYAYSEGGSDPLTVTVTSSKTGGGVMGLMVSASEANTNAVIGSRTGNISDANGRLKFTCEKIMNSPESISVAISFSMNRFQSVEKSDEEFYAELQKLQRSISANVNLTVSKREKVIPTALVIIRVMMDKNSKYQDVSAIQKFQDSVSGMLANRGYNIVTAEVPAKVWEDATAEKQIKNGIAGYLKKNYPNVKRLSYGILSVNPLGKIGEDVKFSSYDINDSGLVSVEVNFTLSMIDLSTGKVDAGKKITARSYGLNSEQAAENAEQSVLEQLKNQVGN